MSDTPNIKVDVKELLKWREERKKNYRPPLWVEKLLNGDIVIYRRNIVMPLGIPKLKIASGRLT